MAVDPERDDRLASQRSSSGRGAVSSRRKVSFRATVVFAFAMIAGSTAAILLIITIFIFNTYFSSYAYENMESVASYAADQVSEEAFTAMEAKEHDDGAGVDAAGADADAVSDAASEADTDSGSDAASDTDGANDSGATSGTDAASGSDTDDTVDSDEDEGILSSLDYAALADRLRMYGETGLMVVDADGQTVYATDNAGDMGAAVEPGPGARVASAPIILEGENIGSVRVWVEGSDALMNQADVQFRNNTVESLFIAGGISLLVAILLGIFFSNWIVAPIKRITAAADQLSEGDLSARTGMTGDNEIDQLGRQFDLMAESIESDRMMELRLTSDVAHELRTPLMAVQSTVEAMIDGVYETDVEHLSVVDSEIRRLSHLVDALLRLSRLERRSQPLNEEVTDLGDLTRTMVASHEVFVHESGLAIEVHVEGTVLAVCDRDLIRQAVANLISNAVRYTPEGGRIDLYVHEEDTSDGVMAAIDVKDTGIGLTEEEAKMVFARFWRAEKRRSDKSSGLGIGLTVVKEIVDRHKGTITVHGEPGKGSTFSILLPAYDPDAEAKDNARGSGKPGGKQSGRGAGKQGVRGSGKQGGRGGNKQGGRGAGKQSGRASGKQSGRPGK